MLSDVSEYTYMDHIGGVQDKVKRELTFSVSHLCW